jgi:hypothetical protein
LVGAPGGQFDVIPEIAIENGELVFSFVRNEQELTWRACRGKCTDYVRQIMSRAWEPLRTSVHAASLTPSIKYR